MVMRMSGKAGFSRVVGPAVPVLAWAVVGAHEQIAAVMCGGGSGVW
jgi:hypothetical protein